MTPAPAAVELCLCALNVQVIVFSPVCLVIVQVAAEDRLKQLQEAHRDFGPSSQHFLSSEYGANYLSHEIRKL